MPSRPLSPGSNLPRPSFLNKTRVIFLVLTISSSAVILFTIIYFLYHLWTSLSNRARTIPFDSSAPLKLQRFCYKDLKNATDDFDDANIIGKGGSGTVFRGIVSDGKLFAIKRLDTLSLQTEREFQNELQILGGLRSPFLVTLLRRFDVILDVAKALEFLHLGCDPPVEGFGVDLFSQELWKSQELSGTLGGTTGEHTPAIGTPMDSNNTEGPEFKFFEFNANLAIDNDCKGGINGKGKDVTCVDTDGMIGILSLPYDDEFGSIGHSKELNSSANLGADEAAGTSASMKQWGKDWWWRQDGSELCSKDYVMEWIGSQICPSNPDWDDEKKPSPEKTELDNSIQLDKLEDDSESQMQGLGFDALDKGFEKKEPKPKGRKNRNKTHRKMQEWWKDDHLGGFISAGARSSGNRIKMPVMRMEFSFRRGWRRKNNNSIGSDMWMGIFSVALAQSGNILELVDERLKDEYNKEQASLCINLALSCLQKMPELRPDIMEIVKILKGDMDLPTVPVEFSPSPPSKLYNSSRRKQKANAD
ncbi:cytochrome P450 71A1-like [Hibiscus syriacus]|uniref:Cytochrome P450 71A1-like n=1 Tax=Hibiscus syriacus TaxID=106335 RepID=A0A6A3A8Z2_HIBSY|nr:cytochrome P450 71A1-like [Hibiscus syriacus]